MDNKEKYMKVPLIKSMDSINQIEEGKLLDYDTIYYNNINNFYNTKKFYAYKIKDNTMEPKIYKNDIVIFETTQTFSNSDICVVKIANEEAIVRRVLKSNGYILLESLNREYDTTVYKEEDLNTIVKIIGKVNTLIRKI